jgi:hypothetical protein
MITDICTMTRGFHFSSPLSQIPLNDHRYSVKATVVSKPLDFLGLGVLDRGSPDCHDSPLSAHDKTAKGKVEI